MVFGLFSKDRAIKRAMKKAQNKLANSQDRWPALQRLVDEGDEESLYVVLKRFSFTSTKQVEDLEEKDWVVKALTAKGDTVLPALRRYLKNAESISYPLRILEGAVTPDKAIEVVDEVLEQEEPGYSRDPAKKCDLINWLGEYESISAEEMVKRVAPYLDDYDENVKYAAVSSIALRPTEDAAERLVNRLLDPEEESRRLKVAIGEVLAEANLPLCDRHKEVSDLFDDILEGYKLHRNRLQRKDD